METLKAFNALEQDLRKETNAELRQAAKTCATVLAAQLARAAAGSGVPVAPLVARSIKVKSDRVPVVSIGGSARVGRYGAPASALAWGSEHGGHNFAAGPSSGYWIRPTVEAFQGDESIAIYKRAVYDLQRKHDLV